ncbi:Ras and/or Miro domain containing protein [Asbolus verrucosus]|uniref:Ras and/or Miro domain containing protein n=1 Tax=Asbolus verrucosus TaxID=1661398 RepID=A0A482VJI5_ASBVE|nr:Ras and/or Miro domain containing protein [Asbolus verrucosus]
MTICKKIVVVGEVCGKSCLINTFINGEFEGKFLPTVFDTFKTEVEVDCQTITLEIFDSAAPEEFDRFRVLHYEEADVFLLCFAVDSPHSFKSVERRWLPEIRNRRPGVPFLLVGNRSDLRDESTLKTVAEEPISPTEANALAKKIGAADYIECSAKTKKNVENVFRTATAVALRKETKESKCSAI